MEFQAQTDCLVRVLVAHRYDSLQPACGQRRQSSLDAVGVVAVGLVEQ